MSSSSSSLDIISKSNRRQRKKPETTSISLKLPKTSSISTIRASRSQNIDNYDNINDNYDNINDDNENSNGNDNVGSKKKRKAHQISRNNSRNSCDVVIPAHNVDNTKQKKAKQSSSSSSKPKSLPKHIANTNAKANSKSKSVDKVDNKALSKAVISKAIPSRKPKPNTPDTIATTTNSKGNGNKSKGKGEVKVIEGITNKHKTSSKTSSKIVKLTTISLAQHNLNTIASTKLSDDNNININNNNNNKGKTKRTTIVKTTTKSTIKSKSNAKSNTKSGSKAVGKDKGKVTSKGKGNVKSTGTKTKTSSKEKKPRAPRPKKLPHYGIKINKGEDFEGYDDSVGSVMSGLLEEDICFECGKLIANSDAHDLVLCDTCGAEYHIPCLGPSCRISRVKFCCPRCRDEELAFEALKFDVSKRFPIPRKKKTDRSNGVSYSPSKPLALAWLECQQKGFMVASRVFDYQTMRMLTHGVVEKVTTSGRSAARWLGATQEFASRFDDGTCTNIVDRGGRYDLRIPDFVIEQLKIVEKLEPILSLLRTIMGTHRKPEMRTHNIIFVPVGSKAQEWHFDDTMRRPSVYQYFTILIPLNPVDSLSGGTEVWSKSLKQSDLIRPRPGDAFVFHGALEHRGQENLGHGHRLFYYASFACKEDANTDKD